MTDTGYQHPRIIRCQQCGKRARRLDGWNEDYIAGMVVGYLCPQCQTSEDDAEAKVNEVLEPQSSWRQLPTGAPETLIETLAKSYPTPERMRHQASRLEAARKDRAARKLVAVMRKTADAMEDGSLWGEPDDRFAKCMKCGVPAPTTVEEFTTWRMIQHAATGERLGVVCPECLLTGA